MKKIFASISAILLAGAVAIGQNVHICSIDELNKNFGTDTHLKENRYKLEPDFRTIVELGKDELGFEKLHYPRIKKLKDGSYIMFYQSSRIGASCYCAFSKDGMSWERGDCIFKAHPIINSGGEKDTRAYSTVDAVVLDNGDILAFVSFRAVHGYKRFPQDDGLCMRRSTDGGRTWGPEKDIYTTITWEPFAMQLPSGEVQVYFTDSDHDWNPPSSGVTMLSSLDRGETWTTHCQVIRQYRATATRKDGQPGTRKVWTDQMPSAVLLGDGRTILAAVESQDSTDHFHITLVKDRTNWTTTLTGDMTGPAERADNFRSGGGPYLAHFPSGETALSFQGRYFNIKLGKSDFKSIIAGKPFQPFGEKVSLWGSMEVIDPHTLFAVAPNLDNDKNFGTIMLGKMRLNHRVDAPNAIPRIDGNNADWADNTDALFLGSDSPAQCSFRFAHDEENLYILAEYLDPAIAPGDEIVLKFSNGKEGKAASSFYEMVIRPGGKKARVDGADRARFSVQPGTGVLAEIAIAKEALPFAADRIFLYASINKPSAGVNDIFTTVDEKHFGTWMPIRIK